MAVFLSPFFLAGVLKRGAEASCLSWRDSSAEGGGKSIERKGD